MEERRRGKIKLKAEEKVYNQTLCFIKRNDELLMLNRESAPIKGLWNGVGGKIKMNETAKECARREVKEETALNAPLDELVYKGLITWEADGSDKGGMYVYLINLPEDFSFPTPKKVREGILDWKKISWLVDDQNLGTGEMIPHYLPNLLSNSPPQEHTFVFPR